MDKLVPSLVSVTLAPGTTAPDWSLTVPRIAPVSTWANVGRANNKSVATNASAPESLTNLRPCSMRSLLRQS